MSDKGEWRGNLYYPDGPASFTPECADKNSVQWPTPEYTEDEIRVMRNLTKAMKLMIK